MTFLTSNDPALILGGLIGLRQLTRELDISTTQREMCHEVVNQTFPLIFNLFTYLQQHEGDEAAEMQLIIVKTLWSVNTAYLPPYLMNDDVFAQWFQILLGLMDRAEPAALATKPPVERAKTAVWRIKKWISFIFRRWLNRYSRVSPGEAKEGHPNATFGPHFMQKYSVPMTQCLLRQVRAKRRFFFLFFFLIGD